LLLYICFRQKVAVQYAAKEMKPRFQGMMQTVWSDAESFLKEFYGIGKPQKDTVNTSANCFRAVFLR